MSKRTLGLAAAIILAVAAVAGIDFVAESRTADAKCPPSLVDPDRQPDEEYYWVARRRFGAPGPTGVSSYILNYSPWVWPGSQTTAWSMLNRGDDRWAQVGWIEFDGDRRYTFFQYTPDHFTPPDQGYSTWYQSPKPVGTSTEYRVEYRNSWFYFYVDGALKSSRIVIWAPNEAQLSGEIHTLSSQMPGGWGSGHSEWFSLSYVELGVGNWQQFGGAGWNSDDRYFGLNLFSSIQHRSWDWACEE